MDFGLSDEQKLLDESLRRFLAERMPTTRVRELLETSDAHDAKVWSELAELGVAGCGIAEEYGGAGLSLLDAAVIATALGHAAAPTPFLGSAILAPALIAGAGSEAQRKEWLPRLAAGKARIGVALAEQVERRDDAGVVLEGGRLRGLALFAIDGVGADAYLVAAGDAVALVARDASGLGVEPMPTIDRTRRLAELRFDGVAPAELLGRGDAARAAIANALLAARVALAADLLGACDRALAMSVDYAKQRKQFDRPIAQFQAVKHLCAEMAAAIEPARALVWYAAHAVGAIPAEAPLLALHAKAHLAEVAMDVVRIATQVHGGIGFTDAYDLQLWFKRVSLARQLLGTPARLRAQAAALQGL
ncbi:MAG TPA: acyl-CoA dehydrogenase family protein [Myxococcota bacterium]|nr:acyl-CoA dehydrogenase family protein [Myxococcota bacterium]